MQKKKKRPTAEQRAHRRRSIAHLLNHMKPFWYMYIFAALCLLAAVLLNAEIPKMTGRVIDEVITPMLSLRNSEVSASDIASVTDAVSFVSPCDVSETDAMLAASACDVSSADVSASAEPARLYKTLLRLLGTILLCCIGKNVFNYLKEYTADITGSRIGRNMRTEMFAHIQKLGVRFFRENNTGELMARIKDDIDQVWFLLGFAGILIIECVTHTLVTLANMLRISPLLTILPLIVMTGVAFTAVHLEKRLDKCFDARSEENAKLTTVAQESIAGMRTVKAFSREQFEIEKFRVHNRKFSQLGLDIAKTLANHQPFMSLATRILIVAVIILGGVLKLTKVSDLSFGDISAFSAYAGNIIWPMECLAWLANELAAAVASNRKLMKILDTEPEIFDPEDPLELENIRGGIEFDNVSFSIEEKDILKNISFTVAPGKTLGIMGLTGSGKSSVINLLERFYDVDSGSIRLDGVDIRRLRLNQLHGSIAAVMQNVFLFSDSIKENISMGRRGDISAEEMREAAESACAEDFIDSMDEGFETIIGERGVGLSGGQKQRISIARAIAKKAPVLVLDDATSALDMETEYQLQQSLKKLECTKIIIAHRISAVRDADEIIVLENGRIIERGTHSQLMTLRGQYFTTYNAQYSTEGKEAAVLCQ